MAMTISARSVLGQRESPRINDLTIKGSSLLKAKLKRLLQLQEKLFCIESVSAAELHARAAGEGQRDQRQHKGAHYFFSLRKTSKTPTKAMTAAAIALNCSGSMARPTAEARAKRPEYVLFSLRRETRYSIDPTRGVKA